MDLKKTEGMQVISSRQIAESTDKKHYDVLRDIRVMCEQTNTPIHQTQICVQFENQDVIVLENEYDLGYNNRKGTEYFLNELAAELLATGYDVSRRLAVLRLIKQLKEKVETMAALPNFNNPVEAARAWADEVEGKQLAQAENKVLEAANANHIQKHEKNAPKVAFADEVVQNDDDLSVGEMAKLLGIGKVKFFQLLRFDRILCKSGASYNTPFQRFIDSGHFKVVLTTYQRGRNTEERATSSKTVVTPKGQIYLTKKYGSKK